MQHSFLQEKSLEFLEKTHFATILHHSASLYHFAILDLFVDPYLSHNFWDLFIRLDLFPILVFFAIHDLIVDLFAYPNLFAVSHLFSKLDLFATLDIFEILYLLVRLDRFATLDLFRIPFIASQFFTSSQALIASQSLTSCWSLISSHFLILVRA